MKGIEEYAPERNEPCPCGSGKKFKKCCQANYRQGHNTNARQKYNQGLYEEALVACRSHLCWYVLCHRAHTVPFLRSATKEAFDLLTIDTEALASLVELLELCYYKVGIIEQFPATLDRLANVVNDSRWVAKIAYFRGLWWLVHKRDSIEASKSLAQIDISRCSDPDVLTLYLDVAPEKLSLSDKFSIIDRICSNTDRESYRLQYGAAKGVAYCLICETEKGCSIIEAAIDRYRSAAPEKRSSYGDCQLGRALYALGAFRGDENFIDQSIDQFQKVIREAKEHQFSKEILSDLFCLLGESFALKGNIKEAMQNYRASLDLTVQPITKIYLAKAYFAVGLEERGQQLLSEFDPATLSPTNRCDYAIALAMLAASTRTPAHLARAKDELNKVQPTDPFFIHQRDKWIIELLQTAPDDVGRFRKLIQTLNKYVTLNPNLFGFGININRMIEDADSAASANRRP
ncbi:MAG TPA: SEC-C metal-binding domain-containing protein [Candidatus Udaeobacter sp.]|jgi:tetratricopeptide (TPR) repeat protein